MVSGRIDLWPQKNNSLSSPNVDLCQNVKTLSMSYLHIVLTRFQITATLTFEPQMVKVYWSEPNASDWFEIFVVFFFRSQLLQWPTQNEPVNKNSSGPSYHRHRGTIVLDFSFNVTTITRIWDIIWITLLMVNREEQSKETMWTLSLIWI